MPAESGGYEATKTTSGLSALMAHDRRVVGRARRIRLVVDGLKAQTLDVLARADQRRLGELRVGTDQRDGLRPRCLSGRELEEALRERARRVRAIGRDLEVTGVLELLVVAEAEETHEGELAVHHDRHGRGDEVRAVARHDEVHLVDVEELRVDAGDGGGVGLVVVEDQLDRAPEQPALLVDVVLPDLHREQRGLAVAGEAAGERHAEADLDGPGALGQGVTAAEQYGHG
jgi:hypothetical protein